MWVDVVQCVVNVILGMIVGYNVTRYFTQRSR